MSELVETLRLLPWPACKEAADKIEDLTIALAKQTEQQAYPCSPHCAGYLRELSARAEIERLDIIIVGLIILAREHGISERKIRKIENRSTRKPPVDPQ